MSLRNPAIVTRNGETAAPHDDVGTGDDVRNDDDAQLGRGSACTLGQRRVCGNDSSSTSDAERIGPFTCAARATTSRTPSRDAAAARSASWPTRRRSSATSTGRKPAQGFQRRCACVRGTCSSEWCSHKRRREWWRGRGRRVEERRVAQQQVEPLAQAPRGASTRAVEARSVASAYICCLVNSAHAVHVLVGNDISRIRCCNKCNKWGDQCPHTVWTTRRRFVAQNAVVPIGSTTAAIVSAWWSSRTTATATGACAARATFRRYTSRTWWSWRWSRLDSSALVTQWRAQSTAHATRRE